MHNRLEFPLAQMYHLPGIGDVGNECATPLPDRGNAFAVQVEVGAGNCV
jgi:hypothetical protein